jgi:streptogramin lyase
MSIAVSFAMLGSNLSAQTIAQFSVPSAVCPDHGMNGGCQPFGIVGGPDGNVWFTEFAANKIGRITPGGSITEFPIPTTESRPYGITVGPDGNLWFTEFGARQIGRITPAGGITEFPLFPDSRPWAITAGSDGNLWFTENGRIGRMTTAGVLTSIPLPGGPQAIVAGPDGNLWCTELSNKIARITPAGTTTEFPIPTLYSNPVGIAVGPDGNLWFTESAGKIGRITPTGTVTGFPLPDSYGPLGIIAGPDGNLWFTENAVDAIGQITPAGVFRRLSYVPPVGYSEPYAITVGPDGNLWFTESGANTIGRIRLRPQSFSTVTPCRVVDTRDPPGPRGGPALAAGTKRTFTLAGQCGIPGEAAAISANLTVTNPTAAGDLRLYAPGNDVGFASAINYGAGQTRANIASLALGPSGDVTVVCDQSGGTVDFILDVNGYFQ